MKKTVSKTSPKGGRKGCLCPDGKTYSVDCCNGDLEAQGIGSTENQGSSSVTNTNTERTVGSTSS